MNFKQYAEAVESKIGSKKLSTLLQTLFNKKCKEDYRLQFQYRQDVLILNIDKYCEPIKKSEIPLLKRFYNQKGYLWADTVNWNNPEEWLLVALRTRGKNWNNLRPELLQANSTILEGVNFNT